MVNKKGKLANSPFTYIPLAIGLIGLASWFTNMFSNNADIYSFLFWLISYLPNFLLTILVITYSRFLDFYRIYKLYKFIVYIQSFLLILSSIKHGVYIVQDAGVGTMGDANFVAFHICVVIMYEVITLGIKFRRKQISFKNRVRKLLEIVYFLVIFLIPESTANLGFLMIIISLFLFKEFLVGPLTILKNATIIGLAVISFILISKTLVYGRIKKTVIILSKTDLDENPYLSKLNMYKKLVTGEIINGENFFLGLGPSTFTSRSSVVRMPEERINNFPVDLPYFKSAHFAEFISPINSKFRNYSYGNFASPQTTIISITVELGLLGLLVFIYYFFLIFRTIRKTSFIPENEHLQKFLNYFSIFFIINLFYLNLWEYPIVSFTYIIFTFSVISQNGKMRNIGENRNRPILQEK